MTTGHTPAGECRACGYAMDPGTCPECGAVCPDVTPRAHRRAWAAVRRAALAAAVPPALVVLMVLVTMGRYADPFLRVAIPSWILLAGAVLLGLAAYALVCFIRQRPRTGTSAAILLLAPALGAAGIIAGWMILFARFAD